ncbi:hypothetical protein GOBAR_AA33359 [Gossypium barbadense]|uniref:Uncharacterized protein n=1 Tax=Gossypium barbadense TaxID=3634 RepID=A0A2P5W8E4_GOSBA|nr:hypothetical protein GOBAR_AA33359 [Gossypium barbadense]
MTVNLILPDEITTSAQRVKVDRMMRKVQDYIVKSEEDIVQHLITINRKMQEVLWNGHELIRKNKGVRKIARQIVGLRKLNGKQSVFDMPWMEKFVVRKLPIEFLDSLPVIKMEEEEDPKEFPNWIVEDKFEENCEPNIENFQGKDTESEMEEDVEMDLSG